MLKKKCVKINVSYHVFERKKKCVTNVRQG